MSEAQNLLGSVPERWFVLSVRADSPLAAELLVESLLSLGGRAVEERCGELVTHLAPPDEPDNYLREVRAVLEAATGIRDLQVRWFWQAQEEWEYVWRHGLGPRKLTRRIVVTSSWCRSEAQALAEGRAVVIVVDPGMAFGTAEHGSTRGALRLLDRSLSPGQRLLDVGCGSAILAIAAALLGAAHVLAVDLDPWATEAASENVRRNRVSDRVTVETATASPEWVVRQGPFDGIIANIQRGVLEPLLESFSAVLQRGGWLILSGMLEREWPSLEGEAVESGFALKALDADGEWRSGWFGLS